MEHRRMRRAIASIGIKYSTLLILGLILALALVGEAAKTKSKTKTKTKQKQQIQKEEVLTQAEPCRAANCQLPDCRCSDAVLPRSKFQGKESEIPQRFINYLNTYPDVYLTGITRMLEYVKKPVLGAPSKDCPALPEAECRAVQCHVQKLSTGEERYLNVCDKCHVVYPWLENPHRPFYQ